jgi:hypothetical protein
MERIQELKEENEQQQVQKDLDFFDKLRLQFQVHHHSN